VVLGPGRAAYVRNEKSPVRIDSSWRIDAEPRARLNFAALDVGFDANESVVAVSAKQWSRWKPGTPDPGRTPFPPKVFNDGLAAWLTPDRRAVALCRVDDREERITVRDLPSGAERGQVPVRVSDPRFLCVAPDASWVATAGGQKPNNRRVRVWDVATGRERFAFDLDNSVTCLAAAPDGRGLAVGVSDLGRGADNAVVAFDATTGTRLFELATRRKSITALAFSADGKHLAAGFNGAVQLWDVPGRKLRRTLEGFERVVTRLAYNPDGDLIAAGTQDGQVWVWSAAPGRRTQVIDTGTRGVRSLAFSADGKLLVTATNKAPVAVWEVAPEPANNSDPDA
jgi:WD40 repeat protein